MLEKENKKRQKALAFIDEPEDIKLYEYSVLVTSLDKDVVSIIDHYRHRADCENNFDEIKNHWAGVGIPRKTLKDVVLYHEWSP